MGTTILIPTHDHAEWLPFSLASALRQECEVVVIGDGVGDDTRAVMERYPVRFYDFPKGERYGEAYRDEVLLEVTTKNVCYLCDDDILLPGHVALMERLLKEADFMQAMVLEVYPPASERVRPERIPDDIPLLLDGTSFIGLTGTSHTLEAYRRLPHGWRPAPTGTYSDYWMWLQWVEQPWFRGVAAEEVTAVHFADASWRKRPPKERKRMLSSWLNRH